ncbi:hypothetical protein AB0I98_24010 [Streptomyces sp. NPDC050211]|uniref:hypothetical protein n=1 Tax=Streptomyces sp. NPDC050211 TaxID=3154932 RepID=UPI00341C1D3D
MPRQTCFELLPRALWDWAFVLPGPELHMAPPDVRLAVRWVGKASRPLPDLMDAAVMRAVLQVLQLKQDGTVAAAEYRCHRSGTASLAAATSSCPEGPSTARSSASRAAGPGQRREVGEVVRALARGADRWRMSWSVSELEPYVMISTSARTFSGDGSL